MFFQSVSDIAQILANRAFLFDPLDRGSNNPDFWPLERCRTEIAQLETIPQREATTLFQTVLNNDRTHLLDTARQLRQRISNAISQEDVTELGQHLQLFQRLRVIEHPEIERLQDEVLLEINTPILQRVNAFKDSANAYNSSEAVRQLNQLIDIKHSLPGAPLILDINALSRYHNSRVEQYAEQKRREEEINRIQAEIRLLNEEVERQRMVMGLIGYEEFNIAARGVVEVSREVAEVGGCTIS